MALDRADRRNALTPEMFGVLFERVREVAAGSAQALVLAGEGSVFCGGFDLKLCLEQPGTIEKLLRLLAAFLGELQGISKPVVLAAHGAAIAGGCAMLAAADFVVTNETAKIGYPVVPLGVSPAVSAASLRQAVGDGWCRERMLDPGLISGREAGRIGLAHEVVAKAEDVRRRAVEVARMLGEKPPGAFAATKAWVREVSEISGVSTKALAASLSIAGKAEERERLAKMFVKG